MSLLASTQRKKALDLEAQAEALLHKRSWFGAGKERNQEDAAELYAQAANAYKVGGFGHEAGTTYSKAGAIYRDQVKNPSEASKCYSQAGMCACVCACARIKVYVLWNAKGMGSVVSRTTEAAVECKLQSAFKRAEIRSERTRSVRVRRVRPASLHVVYCDSFDLYNPSKHPIYST
jgi:Soluble NSF attachment protein, SNAP